MRPELDAGTSAVLRSKKVFCVCMDKLGKGGICESCMGSVSLMHDTRIFGPDVPLRRTKPSMTGVTLAVELPISMTYAEPLPAAKLRNVSHRSPNGSAQEQLTH